jgi:hypothetical protein
MILVAGCGLLLALARWSWIGVVALGVGIAIATGPWVMARKGFKLVDILAVLAIVLLTLAFLVPAMVQARYRSAGKRTFPSLVPTRVTTLFRADD